MHTSPDRSDRINKLLRPIQKMPKSDSNVPPHGLDSGCGGLYTRIGRQWLRGQRAAWSGGSNGVMVRSSTSSNEGLDMFSCWSGGRGAERLRGAAGQTAVGYRWSGRVHGSSDVSGMEIIHFHSQEKDFERAIKDRK